MNMHKGNQHFKYRVRDQQGFLMLDMTLTVSIVPFTTILSLHSWWQNTIVTWLWKMVSTV